jgi:hypothetical protein
LRRIRYDSELFSLGACNGLVNAYNARPAFPDCHFLD